MAVDRVLSVPRCRLCPEEEEGVWEVGVGEISASKFTCEVLCNEASD